MKKLIFLCILLSEPLYGLAISSVVDVSTDTFTIGELIEYKITLYHPGNYTVVPPTDLFFPEKIEVRERKFKIPKKSPAHKKVKTILIYKITGFEPGEYYTDEFEIELKDNLETRKIPVGKVKLTITEIPVDESDIRDIKPPLSVPYYELIAVLVFLGLALFASLIYLQGQLKKRKQQNISGPFPQAKSPAEIAIEKLNILLSKNLLAEGKIKEFYIELSEIFRHYISDKYNIAAIEKTTSELFQSLKGTVDKKYNLEVKEFLASCDVVKFAKYIPCEDEIQLDIQKMKDLLL